MNHSLILSLLFTIISLVSAAHLPEAIASDATNTDFCQYDEVDIGELYDLFHPISPHEFYVEELSFSVCVFLNIGDEIHGLPLFYTIRAPPL